MVVVVKQRGNSHMTRETRCYKAKLEFNEEVSFWLNRNNFRSRLRPSPGRKMTNLLTSDNLFPSERQLS